MAAALYTDWAAAAVRRYGAELLATVAAAASGVYGDESSVAGSEGGVTPVADDEPGEVRGGSARHLT